jgi:isopenicillin-N N-acyltransferase-like protein
MVELPLVSLSGSPVERGRQHGAALSDRIAANVALYTARMRDDAGLSTTDIAERAAVYLDVFSTLDPDYRATMDGIAEASGQSLSNIAMLNARFELLYSAWSSAGVEVDVEDCTAFGAARQINDDATMRVGQNWDWFPGVQGGLLTWRDGDLSVLAYTEAGIAGAKIGLNSAGIGLCVNGLSSNFDDWRRAGMPFHLRTSRILRSRSLAEAVGHASVDAPSCSANFLIGSRGRIVDVESSPVGSRRLEPAPGSVLVHANHFTDPQLLGVTETWRTRPITTFHRAERLEKLLNDRLPLQESTVAQSLRDHEGGILGVCRHPAPEKPVHLRTHTAFSVMMDLDNGRFSYTDGPPCESEFTTITLADVTEGR